MKTQIVILGAGFGGLEFGRHFAAPDTEITVIDRQNHYLFQPLLYQVATAGLSAPEIAQPIRQIIGRRWNVTVLLDEVIGIDLDRKRIRLRQRGDEIAYDYLIIALGARTSYFGHDEWEEHAPGLKSLDDAMRIRHNVLLAFEEAESATDSVQQIKLMTIVIIGGGPTGVELAGAFSELARNVLSKEFRHVNPAQARVVLMEGLPRVLPVFPEDLSASAERQLKRLGVEVHTGKMVNDIQAGKVRFGNDEVIEAENIIWTAGVAASPLTRQLGVELDKAGRIKVEPDLSLPGYPTVFAVGDIVHLIDAKRQAVPGVSPAAMQMGRHVARLIERDLAARPDRKPPRQPFIYWDKGMMATIGRSRAVARVGRLKFSGWIAWLAWLFVHLIFLIGFRNRLAVLIQWFYSYVNYKRGARIITGLDKLFKMANPKADPKSRAQKKIESADSR